MMGCAKLEKCPWPSRPYRGKDEELAPGLKDGQVGQHTVLAGFIPDRPGLSVQGLLFRNANYTESIS